MKNVLSPIMSFTIFVVSCSTPKEVVTNTNSTQDGLTFATAVVINEKNESKGVMPNINGYVNIIPDINPKGSL